MVEPCKDSTPLIQTSVPQDREAELTELRQQLQVKARENLDLQQRLFHSEHEAARLYRELSTIYAGNVWKAATLYYQARDRFKPVRALAKVARKVMHTLRPTPPKVASSLSPIRVVGFPARSASVRAIPEVTLAEKGKVSVILPVYNQANYLEASIQSVLTQTYANFELIILNDGSTDGVEKVLDAYRSHPKVIVLDQANQRLPAALNHAFRYATGEYYTWTSADNVMLERQLEVLVDYMERRPEVGLVFSDYQAIDDRDQPLTERDFRPQNQDLQDPSMVRLPHAVTFENLHLSKDNFIGASFMYRRSVAWAIGDYTDDTFGGEDYDYWLRIHHLFEMGHVPEVLYKYRVHDNTLNARAKELNLYANLMRLLERDKARNDFLAHPVEIRAFGVEVDFPRASTERKVLVYDYRQREAVAEFPAEHLFVCVVTDVPAEELDLGFLAQTDLILTTDPQVFSRLEEGFRYRVFLLNLERGADMAYFLKLVQNRLFDKHSLHNIKRTPPVVHVAPKLKIAIQVESMDRGGLEEVVFQLITHLDRQRVEPSLVINHHLQGFLGHQLQEMGVPVHLTPKYEGGLEALLKAERFDAVNFHHSLSGAELYKKAGVSTIYTFHTSYTWFSAEQLAERKAGFTHIDRFAAVSSQVRNFSLNKFGIPFGRIQVIPNGLDTSVFPSETTLSRADFGLRDDDFVFLHVGSFNGPKYHQIMLSALERLKEQYQNIKLVFVGNILDKPYFEKIQERVAGGSFGDRLLILDFMAKPQLADLFRHSNCFLLPSLQEGWSIAAMEAMHFGLPLIASDVGSARDIIEDEDIGLIIPNPYPDILRMTLDDLLRWTYQQNPPNLPHLVSAMTRIYLEYPDWHERGKLGTRKIAARFTPLDMAKAYESLILETVGRYSKQPWRFLS